MRADLPRLFLLEAFKPCLHTTKSVQKELSDSEILCTVAASDRIQVRPEWGKILTKFLTTESGTCSKSGATPETEQKESSG